MAGVTRAPLAPSRRAFVASALAAGVSAAAPARALAQLGDIPIGGTATIAVVAPFTGDNKSLGEQLNAGVQGAVEESNLLRTALDRAFLIRTFDDGGLLASALVNAQFAIDDGNVFCVIGHVGGKITEKALEIYATNHMPVIVPATGYDPITEHQYGNVLRLITKDSTEGRLGARYVQKTISPKKVAVLYQDGDYGPDVARGFHNQMLDSKIESSAIKFPYDKPDFDDVTKAVMGTTPPDAVYLAGVAKDMGPVAPRLRAAGFTGRFFASQGFFDRATVTTYKDPLDGIVVSSSMPDLRRAPSIHRLLDDFRLHHGEITPLEAFGYAAAQIAISAIKRAGANDRGTVGRVLGFQQSYDTLVGPFRFNNDGDPQDPNLYFYTAKDGAFKYSASAVPTAFIL
jgi:branched-chain amino acid transport system substrate-binding protein